MSEIRDTIKSINTAQIALIGVFATAIVTLINIILTNRHNRRHLEWQKEQWLKDHKKGVFLDCMNILSASKMIRYMESGEPHNQHAYPGEDLYIDQRRFLDILDSLKSAVPLLTMAAGYCSDDSDASRISDARRRLSECIGAQEADALYKLLPIDGRPQPARLDRGLSNAVDDAYDTLIEVSSRELLRGDLPTLTKK